MEVLFRIKYDSGRNPFNGLDMYYGANSLAALSEFMLVAAHAFINEEIVVRAPAARGFRIVLGKNSIGSLEQIIQLVVTDSETLSLLTDLGKNGLYDLLKYAFGSLLGIPWVINNRKAKKKMRALMQENEDLLQRLERALITAHSPVKYQGYTVALSLGRQPLVTFDDSTLEYLETEVVEPDSEVVQVAVSRFNARTGTGRFITDIESISHGFSPMLELNDYQKTLMADNLGKVARGHFEPLSANVTKVNSRDGRLKRYQLHEVNV